jgi:hypothetical protein
MAKRRVGVEYSPSMLESVRPGAESPDRALYLPTFSHFLVVNKTSLSPSLLSLFLSPSDTETMQKIDSELETTKKLTPESDTHRYFASGGRRNSDQPPDWEKNTSLSFEARSVLDKPGKNKSQGSSYRRGTGAWRQRGELQHF